MAKYQVHFMGSTEVDAPDKETAIQRGNDKLGMEDDIFTMSGIHNVIEVIDKANIIHEGRDMIKCEQNISASVPGEPVDLYVDCEVKLDGLFHNRLGVWMVVTDRSRSEEWIYTVTPTDPTVVLSFEEGDVFLNKQLEKLTCL